MNIKSTTENCIKWIQDWFEENGPDCNAIIGVSGGKDSTVAASLCVKALGKHRVIGLLLPNGVQKDINDALAVVKHLGIQYQVINIKPAVDAVSRSLGDGISISKQTKINLPPRIRMSTLYAFSQSNNGRIVNTCNASEDCMGYSTRWGDAVGDFSPLGNLTVSEIIKIGDHLKLPYELVHKTPIDGLDVNFDGSYVTDEQKMGVSYADIDAYLRTNGSRIKRPIYKMIQTKERASKFKLQMPPVFNPFKK